MKWRKGCTNHPEKQHPQDFFYHPVRGAVCRDCGRKITLLEGTTVNV